MNIKEFAEAYNLHDSLVTSISFSPTDSILDIEVELCFWAQENYDEAEPEVGLVNLLFSDVANFESDGLAGKVDFFSIVDEQVNGNCLELNVLDDFNDKNYTLRFEAESVQVLMAS